MQHQLCMSLIYFVLGDLITQSLGMRVIILNTLGGMSESVMAITTTTAVLGLSVVGLMRPFHLVGYA